MVAYQKDVKQFKAAVRETARNLAECVTVANAQTKGMEAAEILMATHYAATSDSRRLRNGIHEMVSAVRGLTKAVNELKEESALNREATFLVWAEMKAFHEKESESVPAPVPAPAPAPIPAAPVVQKPAKKDGLGAISADTESELGSDGEMDTE